MNIKRMFKHVDRFLGVFITHVIISQLNYFILIEFLFPSIVDPTAADEMGGSLGLVLLSALVSLLSLYSITRLTAIYDRLYLPETLERERKCTNLKERFLCLMKQELFWGEMACSAAIYLILPLKWLQYSFAILLTRSDRFTAKLIALAILLPIFFIITVMARLSAMKHLRNHSEIDPNKPKTVKEESNRLAIRMALAYSLGTPALVTLLALTFSFLPIIRELLPAIVTVAALVLLLPPIVRIIRALYKRKAFVKEMTAICTAKGYALPEITLPYRSLLASYDGENFSVTVNGIRYACKLFPALKRNDPLFLYENGNCRFVHTIRFARMNLFTKITRDRFAYEAEGKKILIINPIPKKVYFGKNGRSDLIDNGDFVGEYKIYSASAFLGALERECLDK